MKTALVISGGGSKGAFAIGALEVLEKKGFTYDLIAGTSTGALIAPMVAINDLKTAAELYTNVRNKDILRHNWRRLYKTALYDDAPLRERIMETMIRDEVGGPARYDTLMDPRTPPVLLCSVSLQTRQVMYFSQQAFMKGVTAWKNQKEFVQAVLGSTNQPLLMPAVSLQGHQLVDGGVREIAPTEIALQFGAERIVVIVNMPAERPPSDEKYNNLFSVGLRTLDAMTEEILSNDIKNIERYNRWLKHVDSVQQKAMDFMPLSKMMEVFNSPDNPLNGKKPIELIVIRPKEALPSDGLDFDPEVMQVMREKGKEAAKAALSQENRNGLEGK